MTIPIVKHWSVSPEGTLGSPIAGSPFETAEEAKTAARTAAAETAGTVFVVYEAVYYAYIDARPVNLLPVANAV